MERVKAEHPGCLLRGSLVSPSLEAAVMNAKYVNAVPLYRQEHARPLVFIQDDLPVCIHPPGAVYPHVAF